MKLIRIILGKVILILDALFSPSVELTRSTEEQSQVDQQTKNLTLYQLVSCPFCVKVRRQIKRLGLNIELKDIHDSNSYAELMSGGKIDQVPCLRIQGANGQVQWMYESSAINEYLQKRFKFP